MDKFLLTIEVSSVYVFNSPTLEILVGGVVVSSATVNAHTGVGSDLLSFSLDMSGSYPSSLSFRFNDGFAEGGRSVTIESVQVNGQAVDSVYISMLTLAQSESASINVAPIDHFFGRTEPDVSDLGTVTVNGTGAGDDIRSGSGNDVIDAGSGNDRIFGGDGDDGVIGGPGDDYIFGGNGNDLLTGGDDNDVIIGGAGDDLVYGNDGNDTLIGSAGNDVLNGGSGSDVLSGDAGDDVLYGESENDALIGGAGDDWLYGDDGNDIFDGGSGNDTIYGGNGADFISGGAGNDEIYGNDDNDDIDSGAGNDIVDGGAGSDRIAGNSGDDVLSGGDDSDYILGDDGDDILNGDAAGDALLGGSGADTLNGGDGGDFLYGHSLSLSDASQIVLSNPGVTFSLATNSFYMYVDTALTYSGALNAAGLAMLNGVAGHLVTISSATENSVVQDLLSGNAVWLGANDESGLGNWHWAGGQEDAIGFWDGSDSSGTAVNNQYTNWAAGEPQGNTEHYAAMNTAGTWYDDSGTSTHRYVIEWDGYQFDDDAASDILSGGNGNDFLYGYGGADTLNGDAGDDFIYGGTGDDTLSGGGDDDALYDDSGANVFDGGAGSDVLDARFQTAIPSLSEQIQTILSENASIVYSSDTGSFYQIVSATLDWDVARSAANATLLNGVGGHLATITSQEEHDFIVGLAIGNNTWLGGSDDPSVTGGSYDDWYWVEGPEAGTQFSTGGTAEPGQFADWNPGQPNDSNNTQNYLYLLNTNNGWADLVIEGDGSTGFVTVPRYLIEWEGADLLISPPVEPAQGAQTMYGGAGDDVIHGGNGNDTLYGDDLAGIETGADYIDGHDGDDSIYGGAGIDEIYGGAGSDTIYGGSGNDTLYAIYDTGASAIPVNVNFDTGTDGFSYADGGLSVGGGDPANVTVTGTRTTSDGYTGNGALDITITNSGGSASNIAGSWSDSAVNLTAAMDEAQLSFAYRLFSEGGTDAGDDIFLYAEIDGTSFGVGGNSWVDALYGVSGTTVDQDSGWLTATIDIGALSSGTHTVTLGLYMSSSSNTNEGAWLRIDDVVLSDAGQSGDDSGSVNILYGDDGNDVLYGSNGTDTLYGGDGDDQIHSGSSGGSPATVTLLNDSFAADSEDFTYSDGGFGGGDSGNDVAGTYQSGDGYTANGSLQVYATGAVAANGSGNWGSSVSYTSNLTNVQISFAYRHWHANQNDTNEDSQVYFEFNGTIYDASGGNSYISQALGSGGTTDTGWTTVTIDLPDMVANTSYDLSIGILHTGSSGTNESAYVRIDDVLVTGDTLSTGTLSTLAGGDGQDDLYGSDGQDIFVFEAASAFNDVDTVNDFSTAGGDALDLSDILSGAGYDPMTDLITDFVQITTSGSDSIVKVDVTGAASFGAGTQIATIVGVTGLTDEAALVASGSLIAG